MSMTKSGKNIKQKKIHKTKMSIPYKGKNTFIDFHKWILDNTTPGAVHMNIDLFKRKINLIVDNNEDAMVIFIHWF
jgi:hypothetical protein